MDTLTIGLIVAASVLAAGALLLWFNRRAVNRSIDAALERIGIDRARRTSRTDALGAGVDRVERYISQAEKDHSQLVNALHAADVGIMITNDAGVVTYVNAVAERYVGARHGEAVAEVRLREVLDDVIATRRPASQELDLLTPARRILRLRAHPIEHGVESLGAVLYIEDLTERHRVDTIRRDFVANVGHELKTPLGALSILSETLRDTDDTAVRDKLAERLAGESQRMAKLVEDLLDLSHVESQGAPATPVAVADVVGEAVRRLKVSADEAGIDLHIESNGDDAMVLGDKRQLVSAVSNLIDNAVKFSFREDSERSPVFVGASVDGDWVNVSVRDEGIGIAEPHLDRIFERFYRVDRARSRATGGTGLGLSIVRHVALNHRGEIGVSSEEGRGSTFTLRLPRWKE